MKIDHANPADIIFAARERGFVVTYTTIDHESFLETTIRIHGNGYVWGLTCIESHDKRIVAATFSYDTESGEISRLFEDRLRIESTISAWLPYDDPETPSARQTFINALYPKKNQ